MEGVSREMQDRAHTDVHESRPWITPADINMACSVRVLFSPRSTGKSAPKGENREFIIFHFGIPANCCQSGGSGLPKRARQIPEFREEIKRLE